MNYHDIITIEPRRTAAGTPSPARGRGAGERVSLPPKVCSRAAQSPGLPARCARAGTVGLRTSFPRKREASVLENCRSLSFPRKREPSVLENRRSLSFPRKREPSVLENCRSLSFPRKRKPSVLENCRSLSFPRKRESSVREDLRGFRPLDSRVRGNDVGAGMTLARE